MWPQWLRGARRGLGCDGDPIEQTPDDKLAHAEAVRVKVAPEDGYPAPLLFGSGSDSSGSARTIRSANATCPSFSGSKKAKLCAFRSSCSGETVSKSCPKEVTSSAAEPDSIWRTALFTLSSETTLYRSKTLRARPLVVCHESLSRLLIGSYACQSRQTVAVHSFWRVKNRPSNAA